MIDAEVHTLIPKFTGGCKSAMVLSAMAQLAIKILKLQVIDRAIKTTQNISSAALPLSVWCYWC